MYSVKFNGNQEVFQMEVKPSAMNLIQIFPPFPEVDITAGFEILTKAEGGRVFGDYRKYTTIYREMEDGSIILSNDGSVYTEPVYAVTFFVSNGKITGEAKQTVKDFEDLMIPDVEMDEHYEFIRWNPAIPTEGKIEKNITFYAQTKYIPTLEEVKAQKKTEVSVACKSIIHAGIDVKIGESTEHFSLETNDQINLFGKQYQLAAGATHIEYHQDGHPCKYYTAEEMQKIITVAMDHVSYHTTYCNSLNMWIAGATSKEEVNVIFYGADIPEEYQSEVLKDYLVKIMAEVEDAGSEANT